MGGQNDSTTSEGRIRTISVRLLRGLGGGGREYRFCGKNRCWGETSADRSGYETDLGVQMALGGTLVE